MSSSGRSSTNMMMMIIKTKASISLISQVKSSPNNEKGST